MWEGGRDLGQRCLHLLFVQIQKDRLRNKTVRSGALTHYGHPAGIDNRCTQGRPPPAIGEEPLPQRYGVRKIQIEPMHGAIIEPFKAGVESRANLDHRPFRMAAEKLLDELIKRRGPQDTAHEPARLVNASKIPIDRLHHLDGVAVLQDRTLLQRLHRPGIQRNPHCLFNRTELDGRAPRRPPIQLGAIEETMRVPLYARAVETLKKRPVLKDSNAVEMVEAIDWDFRRIHQTR